MKGIALFVVVAAALQLQAQDPLVDFNRLTIANWNSGYLQVGPYRVKGTPFLFGKSFPGEIEYSNGVKESGKNILYDIYQQKAGPDVNNNLFEADQPVARFVITLPKDYGGQRLQFARADAFGKSPMKGFVAVLADGEVGTFLKYYKAVLMADPVNQMDKQARAFDQVYEYYLFNKSTGNVSKIKLSEKSVMKQLKGDADFASFIKAKGLDLSRESDVSLFIQSFK